MTLKDKLKPYVPRRAVDLKRVVVLSCVDRWDRLAVDRFVVAPHPWLAGAERKRLRDRYLRAHGGVRCTHTHREIMAVTSAILATPRDVPGVIVEAGCFKGGSTAKLSIAAKMAGRKLVVFDSFEGLPAPVSAVRGFAEHQNFRQGEYAGSLDEVRENVRRYGEIDACEFVKGWFSDTMPRFTEPVITAFVDVDLADSVRTCMRYLYPLLIPNGVIFSHDGHVPTCVAAFADEEFWRTTVGVERPPIAGLGEKKLLSIPKGSARRSAA